MVVKKVGVLSMGKISGLVYAGIGLIAGVVISMVSVLGGFAALAQDEAAGVLGMVFGVGSIIILPLFYGVMGFIGGLITGLIYNVAAGLVGGLELELE